MTDSAPDTPTEAQAELGWRRVVQQAIWCDLIAPHDNEWTTWSDAIVITEKVREALEAGGYAVVRHDLVDAWLRSRGAALAAEVDRLWPEAGS